MVRHWFLLQREFRTRLHIRDEQAERHRPEYFGMHLYPLILLGIDPHLAAHALQHLGIPADGPITCLGRGRENETPASIDGLLAAQSEIKRLHHLSHQRMVLAAFSLVRSDAFLPVPGGFMASALNLF